MNSDLCLITSFQTYSTTFFLINSITVFMFLYIVRAMKMYNFWSCLVSYYSIIKFNQLSGKCVPQLFSSYLDLP